MASGYRGGQLGSAARWPAPSTGDLDLHAGATWPIAASASSEFRPTRWHAGAACGRPDVWPSGSDSADAWAPAVLSSPVEWLEVRFDPGPPAERIRVFETCGSGAVYAVAVDAGGGFELVWLDAPRPEVASIPQLLDVRLPEPVDVHAARLYIDNTPRHWTEIDTVARLAAEADAPRSTAVTGEDTRVEPGRGRRYSRRQIEGVDSLVASRGVWPVAARASSEYGGWYSAAQIVGRPKVWPRAGDRAGAWAPRTHQSPFEWIEATFPHDTPPARAIRVFETCGPGHTVELRVGADDELHRVWRADPEPLDRRQARVLEVDLPELERVERVWCGIDNSARSWVEIDSIALLTIPRGAPHVPRGSAYRGRTQPTLRDRLAGGPGGAVRGRARRMSFFELMSHDWRACWRGAWPVSARASSSQGGLWAAGHATGPPTVYPVAGGLPGAWAPAESDVGSDWLELSFDTQAPASAIRVFETGGAGATFAVTIVRAGGESLVFRAAPEPCAGARVLEVELPRPQRIERVCVYVDNAVPGGPKIDTVGLVTS